MSNELQSIFDLCWESGRIFFTWLFDGWIQPKINLDEFFIAANIKNNLGEYPKVVKNNRTVFIVKIPTGLNLDNFKRHQEALEIYLNNRVKIENSSGWLRIEMLKELPEVIEYEMQKRTAITIRFNIGKSLDKTITLDLKENPHSYIVGTTGSGKSVMTKVILSSLVSMYNPNELELYLADCKRVELNLFRNVQHCKKFVYRVEDITQLISDLLEETNRRYDLFMEKEVTDIFEYNKLHGVKKLKYQVLYLEEIVMLLEDKKKNAMKLLKQLIAISRASGLYIFLTTQRPSNDVIDNVVKANINNRIVFKCEDSKNSIVALDEEGAENLKGNGHGIIKRGSEKIEFKGYFISNEQVKKIIKPYIIDKNENENRRLLSKTNKRGLEKDCNSNDKLQGKEKKTCLKANEEVNFQEDLSFLDRL